MDGYDEPLVMICTFGSGVFLFLGTAVFFRWAPVDIRKEKARYGPGNMNCYVRASDHTLQFLEYKEAPRNSCETVIKKDLQLKKFKKLNKLHVMIELN